MSTLAPNLAIKDPRSRDAGGGSPPSYGGGGDGNEGGASNGAFNYGERLRRARLGLVLGLTAVLMLFVGFTSALLVRKGLPSFDPADEYLFARLGHDSPALHAAAGEYVHPAAEQRDDGVGAARDHAASGAGSGKVDSRGLVG